MARKNKNPDPPEPWAELPEILRDSGEGRWRAWLAAAGEAGVAAPVAADFRRIQCRVFACSEFVARACTRYPGLLRELLDNGDLLADSAAGALAARVAAQLEGCDGEHELHHRLRTLRRREMVRIAWRDLAGWATLAETLGDLSDLADTCIRSALAQLTTWQAKETPAPVGDNRKPVPLVVIAMGKLGAHELNFSSDIDLIFAYPDARAARKRAALSPEQYFGRLGQALIQALSSSDADGFVFRVDMRLRPYGSAGALACSYEALEDYYQSQGREWERYAMIKARPVTGDAAAQQQLMELLRPFVYRRYLDFHSFDALRNLKRQIHREVQRKGQQENLKLGPGGIREIEFIAQAFQLVRGGREPRLRQRRVLDILPALEQFGLMTAAVVRQLCEAYVFLRQAENRLQAMQDQQTQHLPQSEDDQARLALAMQFSDWKTFLKALNQHRRRVERHFREVFAAPQEEVAATPEPLVEVWNGELSQDQARQVLREAGYQDVDEALRWIDQLRGGTASRLLGEQGRTRFDALVPRVLTEVAAEPQAAQVLARLVQVLEHIAGRTTYLALLQENPQALSQLVRLCSASAWIAGQIARFPLLLDQLLDPRCLHDSPRRRELETELERYLQDVDTSDLEQQMDRLRQFKHAMVLRIAAADIAGVLPVMEVSDELSDVAELVVGHVLTIARADMLRRYGEPRCRVRGKSRAVAFAIVGYGKLGGRELGYGSDLDLVFLHDSGGSKQRTAGKKSVDNSVFFARLGQRIIHMLEILTPAGVLYEVDMRLRPSGNSGLLVSSLEAFTDYQRTEAWTWEHQALIRARVVAGDAKLAKAFERSRKEVLTRARDAGSLRAEVSEMRERMRAELDKARGGRFQLKQGRGGIVDIEFMVQYLVLRGCREHPALLRRTDTIGLLETLVEEGLLPPAEAETLAGAYREYRALVHRRVLAEDSAVVDAGDLQKPRDKVIKIWRRLMEG